MHIYEPRAAFWVGGLKTAAGFALTLTLLLLVNLAVYQKMREFTLTGPDSKQADELLRILVVTDLFAIVFLSMLVLLLNRQLTVRDAAARDSQEASDEQETQLRERIDELTRLNQTLQTKLNERQHYDAQLKQFQKMESLGKLVGSVGHEFNNYLTVILGFSEQLLMQMPPNTSEHATVGEIYKAGERSAELTRSLLGLVRSSDAAQRPTDINCQAEAMRRMLNLVTGKRVRLEMVLQEGLPLVMAVPGQIEQVLLNLATNARDAMPDGGRLLIETCAVRQTVACGGLPAGRYVLLTVTDTGNGLSDEIRRRLFEPFFTTKPQGTGLGLATVRDIVVDSGGCVLLDSPPGQGATFQVYWPALPADEVALAEESMERHLHDTIRHELHGEHDTLHN